MFYRVTTVLGILASILSLNLSVQAQTCTPLSVVGGQGSEVNKTVSAPTIPGPFGIVINRNNYNTDWAVPSDVTFRSYVATITSNDGGSFDLKMYLKYSNQTADEFYNENGVQLTAGTPLKIEATPRPEDEPYQVNLYVDGLDSLGKSYTALVDGCR